ncbi:MAG: HEAT repeat domain-containing protein [Nodosilinea sp.]
MSDSLSALIKAVETADSAAALTDAVEALANANCLESAPILIEALSYNNPGAAVAAVDGLVRLGQRVVPSLLEQIDQNNYTARSWAIRALAGIGDPRGLVTLLGVATADFSMSVRRAAARGLGNMQWHLFPPKLLEVAQAEVLDALLFVARHDEEWVVRYAAVVGLECLGLAAQRINSLGYNEIQRLFDSMAMHEESVSVRARARKAQLSLERPIVFHGDQSTHAYQVLTSMDWEQILEKLYARKVKERELSFEEDLACYQQV